MLRPASALREGPANPFINPSGGLSSTPELELAASTRLSAAGGIDVGEVCILSLRTLAAGDAVGDFGKVLAETRLSALSGGFPAGQLGHEDRFGSALAPLSDLDGDGVEDLAVSALNADDGGSNRGVVWVGS